MSISTSTFICALSGIEAPDAILVNDAPEVDDLETLPVGWMRVDVRRRALNSAWIRIQQAKANLTAQLQMQVPEPNENFTAEQRQQALEDLAISVHAQFYSLEQDTPKYINVEETVVVANPEDKQIAEAWGPIAQSLGITVGVGR